MTYQNRSGAAILGLSLIIGLTLLGFILAKAAIDVKEYERSVTVKGLAEREVPADVVIWPIVFTEANNDLTNLYTSIDQSKQEIVDFLVGKGIEANELTHSLPSITDKSAQQYGGGERAEFRYVAKQTVTVYSTHVDQVRKSMTELSELGKSGIAFSGGRCQGSCRIFMRRFV